MTTPKIPTVTPEPVEDQPPWVEREFVRDPAGTEAVTVAWTQIAVPYTPFTDEMADPDEEPAKAYAPWNITFRGLDPDDLIDKLAELTAMIAASDVKFITDKQFSEFAISQRFVPQPQASSPLPQAAPQQAKTPWKPGGAPAPAQQQAPAQQHQAGDNTFIADTLLVANKAKLDGTPYTELRMKGGRYVKFGVRVWKEKLDAVLPGWSEAPPGEHSFMDENGVPFKVKCTFSWDDKPGKDGTPQPKNVYTLELV